MKITAHVVAIILIMVLLFVPWTSSFATTDGFYTLTSITTSWDGTDANRQKAKTADYAYTYGDEASVTYTLPWAFVFYGEAYSNITADTNGNIWFGSTGSAHSINLANIGRGPVIAVWNDDLSSYYYGGVFIQHKNNPERVVIEWQTETYTNEGLRKPNNFEVVLFPNGNISLDYKSFTSASTNKDFGSGVSKGDGSALLGLTANYGNIFTLPNTSFQFQLLKPLAVLKAGSGGGTVTSSPVGITCGSACSSSFGAGTLVTLTATPDTNSTFAGWSGACSGTGTCQVTMGGNQAVTSTFNMLPPATSFSVSPPAGSTPLLVNFTDSSLRATSWSWGFGDGTTSTAQNLSHVYKMPGNYTVTLTATNVSGPASAQQNITVSVCQTLPIRIKETNSYYATLAAALGAVADGQTIQLQGWDFAEGATISKSITLDGGYDCTFTNKTGRSLLGGEFHINGGAVRMKDVQIAKTAVSADYSLTAQTGNDPLLVTFTDNTQNATSWSWDFGDGSTSTDFSPTHVYRTPGTYTAILTVGNAGGTAVSQKTITVTACLTQPVRIKETNAYYATLADALGAVTANQTIQLQDRTFAGDITIGNTITLDGGYDCGYSTVKTGKTVLQGGYHINGGTVTMKDVHVAK